ncbi:hypothetical protein BH10BAC5_BH10BAC5_16280 [soil metagenome]
MNILTGRDIVITGLQPWDVEIGSNCKNIALELSKNNRVLYVNSPLDRITVIKEKNDPKVQKRLNILKGQSPDLVQINDNLWNFYPGTILESVNWLRNEKVFEVFNKRNNKKFAKEIEKAINRLGFTDIILFNDNDIFRSFYLPDILKPDLSIYYSRDNLIAVDYWKHHGAMLEPELIKKSSICIANSTYLTNYCKKYNPNSFYIGQGCEIDDFINTDKLIVPREMKSIERPVIGYVGALSSLRLSIETIQYIAQKRLDWNIVLVGPEDEGFMNSKLHEMKNVYFMGAKEISELPSFINSFDVCINPQILNDVTKGNYPRKIDEYLAMGKPVVATKTDAMSVFSEHVYLAESKEEYISHINKAFKEDSLKEQLNRINFAKHHTWENSVGEIYRAINLSRAYACSA